MEYNLLSSNLCFLMVDIFINIYSALLEYKFLNSYALFSNI